MTDVPKDLVLIPALFCDDGRYADVLPLTRGTIRGWASAASAAAI